MRTTRRLVGPFGLLGLLVLAAPAHAGGVAIVRTILQDDGDHDGYADTFETVTMRLEVLNTSGTLLTNVTAEIATGSSAIACIRRPSIAIGTLAIGERRITSEAFVFTVGAVDRTTSGQTPYDELSASFDLQVDSDSTDDLARPDVLTIDLDLDVAAGSGPQEYLETFESGTLGTFGVQNIDALTILPGSSDGYRCQYSDPDWPNSNTFGMTCNLGTSASQASAVFWHIDGPGSLGIGRAFGGVRSAHFGIDVSNALGFTTPSAVLEALRTGQPINVGWDRVCATTRSIHCVGDVDCPSPESCVDVAPTLRFLHQVSLMDHRNLPIPDGRTVDRGVVAVQRADALGTPVGPWIKLTPYLNTYDEQADDSLAGCTFDPVDDGSTEDHFFDPSDPQRRLGPSSTCFPEPVYAYIGDTDAPFAPGNLGNADGPGLPGSSGIGTWVETRIDLGRFRGQRIRVRFLATTLKIAGAETWEALFTPFNPTPEDDGWWLDDVRLTDTLGVQALVTNDTKDNGGLPGAVGGDGDDDGVLAACDCDDASAATYPGAVEVNDGLDNQCPDEAGAGLTDELSGAVRLAAGGKLSWPAQSAATSYQVVRNAARVFASACTLFTTATTTHDDFTTPSPGGAVLYYLVRPLTPHAGSWGQRSSGVERTPCAP